MKGGTKEGKKEGSRKSQVASTPHLSMNQASPEGGSFERSAFEEAQPPQTEEHAGPLRSEEPSEGSELSPAAFSPAASIPPASTHTAPIAPATLGAPTAPTAPAPAAPAASVPDTAPLATTSCVASGGGAPAAITPAASASFTTTPAASICAAPAPVTSTPATSAASASAASASVSTSASTTDGQATTALALLQRQVWGADAICSHESRAPTPEHEADLHFSQHPCKIPIADHPAGSAQVYAFQRGVPARIRWQVAEQEELAAQAEQEFAKQEASLQSARADSGEVRARQG